MPVEQSWLVTVGTALVYVRATSLLNARQAAIDACWPLDENGARPAGCPNPFELPARHLGPDDVEPLRYASGSGRQKKLHGFDP